MKESYAWNSLIVKLIKNGQVTEEELKRQYRELCKSTHPDVTGLGGEAFLKLQTEYDEALEFVLTKSRENYAPEDFQNPRKSLYDALHRYTALNLHSAKVRLKESLKERNRTVILNVIRWAQVYDPEFVDIFLLYNRSHLPLFADWHKQKIRKQFKEAFLRGFANFLDYQKQGAEGTKRIALSYLKDAEHLAGYLPKDIQVKAIIAMIGWCTAEAEELPVCRQAPGFRPIIFE